MLGLCWIEDDGTRVDDLHLNRWTGATHWACQYCEPLRAVSMFLAPMVCIYALNLAGWIWVTRRLHAMSKSQPSQPVVCCREASGLLSSRDFFCSAARCTAISDQPTKLRESSR